MSSASFGDAIAHERAALFGRAGAIAPDRVQGGERGEDTGSGSARRARAVVGVRKLAGLYLRDRQAALAWWIWYVDTAPSLRTSQRESRLHLLTLERAERIELLTHRSGPESAGARTAGSLLVARITAAYDAAPEADSGGSWLDVLRTTADRALTDAARDEMAARLVRASRKLTRKEARR